MTKQELIESKDEEMNGLIEIHHEQCKELELKIQSLKEELQKCENEKNEIANNANLYIKKLEARLYQ